MQLNRFQNISKLLLEIYYAKQMMNAENRTMLSNFCKQKL